MLNNFTSAYTFRPIFSPRMAKISSKSWIHIDNSRTCCVDSNQYSKTLCDQWNLVMFNSSVLPHIMLLTFKRTSTNQSLFIQWIYFSVNVCCCNIGVYECNQIPDRNFSDIINVGTTNKIAILIFFEFLGSIATDKGLVYKQGKPTSRVKTKNNVAIMCHNRVNV